ETEAAIPDALSRLADHIVLRSGWFPFAPGALEDIRSILAEAGISNLGHISLRQYLQLKKLQKDHTLISDLTADLAATRKTDDGLVELPREFSGKLYPYQLDGLRWLNFIAAEELG